MLTVPTLPPAQKLKSKLSKPRIDEYERKEFNQKLKKRLLCTSLVIISQPIIYMATRKSFSSLALLITVTTPTLLYFTYLFFKKSRTRS